MAATHGEEGRDKLDRLAAERRRGVVDEFWAFLRFNKKWWLLPIIVLLLLLAVVALTTSTAVAPFIYTLF